jgi:DNA-binding SARP family transcriptional activator
VCVSQQSHARTGGQLRAPTVSIRLLGTFAVDVGGKALALPVGAQRLVAMLALRGRTGRSRLAGLLWPEMVEQRALASLRTGIWRVNQTAPGLIEAAHGIVQLGLVPAVDVDELITASRAVLGGAHADRDEDEPAFATGELLPDWDDPWLHQERERLHQLRLHVLEATAEQLADRGRYGLALEAALAALRADDLRESAHRAVISIHLAEGNVAEARRAYEHCRRTLRAELGIEPSSTTSALVGAVRVPSAPAVRRPAEHGAMPARPVGVPVAVKA